MLSTIGAGLPPRIILDRTSLTIKTGVANSKTLPYSSISDVRLTGGLTSVTSSLFIVPFRGAEIRVDGFSRKDFNLIKQAVADGYFEDDFQEGDNEETDNTPVEEQHSSFKKQVAEEASDSIEINQIVTESDRDIEKILNMVIDPSDEKSLVNNLNSLIDIIEIKSDKKVVKTALSKYENNLKILQLTYPDNRLNPYFSAKPAEWKEAKQKRTKKNLIKWAIILGVILIIFLFLLSQL